jgi:7-cyano-7-deazaguanine synthase
MKCDAVVLLSGGLDSTVALYEAIEMCGNDNVGAVSVNYGQRHGKELEAARRVMEIAGCKDRHAVIDLPEVLPVSMLTNVDEPIPNKSYAEIEGVSPTYVPFRNGTLLSIAAAVASAAGAKFLYAGMHSEDAHNWAYPDCTFEFLGAMGNAIYIGTYHKVRLIVPLVWMTKAAVVRRGNWLCAPLEETWSCYAGGDKHCGLCMTCRARRDAFKIAGIIDRTEYARKIDAA